MKRVDWNVNIAGRWNRAILTPHGISKLLFQLPEQTAVEVLVPVDTYAPFQVKNKGVTVTPYNEMLQVSCSENIAGLGEAINVASNALKELPRTPVSAIGVNLGYEIDDSAILANVAEEVDNRLSDDEHDIVSRQSARTLKWNEGFLNVNVVIHDNASTNVRFNFHRNGDNKELLEWLNHPCKSFEETAEKILEIYQGAKVD